MCGIVGFTGNHQAAPILLDGLSKLEYRGYDSAGIAVRDGEGETTVIKAKGRLRDLLRRQMAVSLFRVPAVLVIHVGQLMENLLRTMHIRMSAMMEISLPYITESLRITRN